MISRYQIQGHHLTKRSQDFEGVGGFVLVRRGHPLKMLSHHNVDTESGKVFHPSPCQKAAILHESKKSEQIFRNPTMFAQAIQA